MKPFQPRRPGAQIERKWPAAKDHFSFGEEAVAFLAGPRAGGAWCQVACRGEGRPRFANFPVIPAPGVGQFDRRIDRLNLRSIFGADALNTQDVDPLHGHLPNPIARNKRFIVYRCEICNCRPVAAGGCTVTVIIPAIEPTPNPATLEPSRCDMSDLILASVRPLSMMWVKMGSLRRA